MNDTNTDTDKPLGRPRTLEGGRAVPVYLSAAHIAQARELGNGNVSAGVRLALDLAKSLNLQM